LFFTSLVAVTLVLAITLRRRGHLPWLPMVEILVFGILGTVALRGVVWWGMVVPVILAGVIEDGSTEPGPARSVGHAFVIAALVACIGIAAAAHRGIDPSTGAPAMLTDAPERLVEALRREVPLGSSVYASQLHASWAEFSAPAYRYAVDSRLELFPVDVWDRYDTVADGREGWADILAADDVRALLLEPTQARGLLTVIGDDPAWRSVVASPEGSLYVRD
jgi:hypothetical protein